VLRPDSERKQPDSASQTIINEPDFAARPTGSNTATNEDMPVKVTSMSADSSRPYAGKPTELRIDSLEKTFPAASDKSAYKFAVNPAPSSIKPMMANEPTGSTFVCRCEKPPLHRTIVDCQTDRAGKRMQAATKELSQPCPVPQPQPPPPSPSTVQQQQPTQAQTAAQQQQPPPSDRTLSAIEVNVDFLTFKLLSISK
jgi:hypothetical protein